MKKLTADLTFAFMMLISLTSSAQTPSYQWATSGTGSGNESVKEVLLDNNGNIIVHGVYTPPMTLDGTTVTIAANNLGVPFLAGDMYIAKYNSTGNLIWVTYGSGVGTNGQSYIMDMATDPSGNIFAYVIFNREDSIAGTIFGTDTIYAEQALVKFDPNGNLQWHMDFGDQFAAVITTDNSGNVYLATTFGFFGSSSATFDTVTVTNPHPIVAGEIIIVKFNSSGSALWGRTAGGTGSDNPDHLLTDNSGNLYVTGRYLSDSMYFDATNYVLGTSPQAPSSHPDDYFYAKYDSNGNLIWAKNILLGNMGPVPFGSSYTQPALNNNGELFIAGRNVGSSLNIGSLTLSSPGYFVTKMDVNGDPVWATVIGDTLDRDPVDLQLDGFGNLYVAGTFKTDSIVMANATLYNASPGSGSRDLFVAMVDANGSPLGVFKEGGDDSDSPAFTVNANSSMYLGGTFRSNSLTFGNATLNNPNFPSNHMFLTYSTPLFTGMNDLEFSENISIYPNPAQTEINLQLNNISGSPSAVSVLNPLGEVVYSRTVSNELVTTIDVSMLPSGIYMVQDQKSVSSGKFIKY